MLRRTLDLRALELVGEHPPEHAHEGDVALA
jgi:hypothetical protein